MEEVKIGNHYQHFKGHLIQVIALGRHSETLEDMVVYEHLSTHEIWIRPLKMFLSKEDVSEREDNITRQTYRFVLYHENE